MHSLVKLVGLFHKPLLSFSSLKKLNKHSLNVKSPKIFLNSCYTAKANGAIREQSNQFFYNFYFVREIKDFSCFFIGHCLIYKLVLLWFSEISRNNFISASRDEEISVLKKNNQIPMLFFAQQEISLRKQKPTNLRSKLSKKKQHLNIKCTATQFNVFKSLKKKRTFFLFVLVAAELY